VSNAPNILVLADGPVGSNLTDQLADARFVRHSGPYDALMEMGRRSWPVVVLSAPRAEFAGLCRASRRLQHDARLLAVCPPTAEPEVRPLRGRLLDDYFIHPLTRGDLAEICGAKRGGDLWVGRVGQSPLSGPEMSRLIEAAKTPSSLETVVADFLGQRLGGDLIWANADELPVGARPVLLAAGDVPRVLMVRGPFRADHQQAKALIRSLQEVVPSLVSAARRMDSLHRLAITDHLTGAYNRRYFYHLTEQILLRAAQRDLRVRLLLYDMDNFKHYNDTYGYAAGDEILRETASLVRRITRSHDVVARIGGDEFAVLFWDAQEPRSPDSQPYEDAYLLADRFRRAVANHEFPSLGPEAVGALTISGGLAAFPQDGTTCRELLRSANHALKKIKTTGKNAIRLIGGK